MKQHANVYTMMLILAFLALVVGSIFLFLEMQQYGGGKTWAVPPDLKAPMVMIPHVSSDALV